MSYKICDDWFIFSVMDTLSVPIDFSYIFKATKFGNAFFAVKMLVSKLSELFRNFTVVNY